MEMKMLCFQNFQNFKFKKSKLYDLSNLVEQRKKLWANKNNDLNENKSALLRYFSDEISAHIFFRQVSFSTPFRAEWALSSHFLGIYTCDSPLWQLCSSRNFHDSEMISAKLLWHCNTSNQIRTLPKQPQWKYSSKKRIFFSQNFSLDM